MLGMVRERIAEADLDRWVWYLTAIVAATSIGWVVLASTGWFEEQRLLSWSFLVVFGAVGLVRLVVVDARRRARRRSEAAFERELRSTGWS